MKMQSGSTFAAFFGLGIATLFSASTANAVLPSGNFVGQVEITVAVDPTACRAGAYQCAGTTGVIPKAGNRVPIAVKFQALSSGGSPMTSLTSANVAITTSSLPLSGTVLQIRSCATCFQNLGGGVYGFFIEPKTAANWASGTYFVQVRVTSGTFVARALTEVPIPF